MTDVATVVAPEVGMSVTWIDPEEDRVNARFIEAFLIGRYGTKGLKIASVVDRCKFNEAWIESGKQRYEVTLERDGVPLMDTWNPSWGTQPENFTPRSTSCSWHYLKPIV